MANAGDLSVGGASLDDPLGGLARELRDELEVGVVVQHDQSAALGHRGHEGVDQRDRPVTASAHEAALNVECAPEIALGGRRLLE